MLTENLGGGSLCDCPSAWEGGAPPRAPGPRNVVSGAAKGPSLEGGVRDQGHLRGRYSASAVITGEVKAAPLGRSRVVKVQTPQDLCAGRPCRSPVPESPGASPGVLCVSSSARLPSWAAPLCGPPPLPRPSRLPPAPSSRDGPTRHGCPLTTPQLSLLRHLRTEWFRKGKGGLWGKRRRRGKRD